MLRNLPYILILLVVLGLGGYWYFTRPTPQEVVLKEFFTDFRNSDYKGAQEYTVGDDFYKMAAATAVRDTSGEKYLIGDYFPPGRAFMLQAAIETYVKRHISKWKYLFMETQDLGKDASVVSFRLELGVRDFTNGDVFGETHDGRIEGTAFMKMDGDEWQIEKFELNFFSDDNLSLKPYLSQVGY